MAYRDELTGLAGRRAFNETLLRLGSDYVIAMIDVDHFNRFNDTYGHEVGDQVLRMIASQIAQVSGGGQHFAMAGKNLPSFFQGKVCRTRRHVRLCFEWRSKPSIYPPGDPGAYKNPTVDSSARLSRKEISVTVSRGASEPSDRRVDPAQVVIAADRALYRAKKAGRNQLKY